jgi:N-acetylmuramate 1-kinase
LQPSEAPFILHLADEGRTILFGEDLALALKAGDCLALYGDLGSGKSTLSRALIRAMADDPMLEVPSPTFTLVQNYRTRIPVAHFDLYRIGDPDELFELGLEEALEDGIALVEWPEMAGGNLPETAIHLTLSHEGSGRAVSITGSGKTMSRIRRVMKIRDFLSRHGYGSAHRRFLSGDASIFRAYEIIHPEGGKPQVLMDWPKPPLGAPVLDGKPYAEVAHLATNALPFIAIGTALHERGFSTPAIRAADRDDGILIMEDLGREGVLDANGVPIEERYMESAACLARLHDQAVPRDIAVGDTVYRVPDFDPTAMKIEVSLLPDWHLPWKSGHPVEAACRNEYFAIWDELIDILQGAEIHLLLRDYHSPNLIWLADRTGTDRVGIIDFQDAMIGPTAYDVASLVQDARVDMDPRLSERLLRHYLSLRTSSSFDEDNFRTAFAIMAAQRNCKLAGIWVRLMKRDGKPYYMKHMPRTLSYLNSVFRHPALQRLKAWCLDAGMELEP